MSLRALRGIALSAFGLSVALVVLSVPLLVANRPFESGITPYLVNLVIAALAFSTVGTLVAFRRWENPIGWLLGGTGLLYAFEAFTGEYSTYALFAAGSTLPGGTVAAWLTSWAWIFGGSLVFFVFLFFPDGGLPSPRWRPLAWLVLINTGLAVAPYALGPWPLEDFGGASPVANPVGIAGSSGLLRLSSEVSNFLLVPIALGLVISFFVRFRRARGEERQQIKWVAYAVALFIAAVIVVSLWPSLDTSVVGSVLFLSGFLAIPSAMALAILRYRLYDIDLLINRTLVYVTLTASLVGAYVGIVVLLQWALRSLTGEGSNLAVVASTLAIAALFSPLRRRIQSFIDRRFYRNKYDATRTLEAFSARLRDETDVGTLSDDLLCVLNETMRPAHASLWLRSPNSD